MLPGNKAGGPDWQSITLIMSVSVRPRQLVLTHQIPTKRYENHLKQTFIETLVVIIQTLLFATCIIRYRRTTSFPSNTCVSLKWLRLPVFYQHHCVRLEECITHSIWSTGNEHTWYNAVSEGKGIALLCSQTECKCPPRTKREKRNVVLSPATVFITFTSVGRQRN